MNIRNLCYNIAMVLVRERRKENNNLYLVLAARPSWDNHGVCDDKDVRGYYYIRVIHKSSLCKACERIHKSCIPHANRKWLGFRQYPILAPITGMSTLSRSTFSHDLWVLML